MGRPTGEDAMKLPKHVTIRIDLDGLIETSRRVEEIVGRALPELRVP